MTKQSFPFNEPLARKKFENENTCKHKSFLTNKLKEELLSFPMHSKRDNQLFSQKFPFSFQSTQPLQKQTFSKRDFFYFFIKHSKLCKRLTLRSINYKNLFEVKAYKMSFLRMFYLARCKLRTNLCRITNQSKTTNFVFFFKMKSKLLNTSFSKFCKEKTQGGFLNKSIFPKWSDS